VVQEAVALVGLTTTSLVAMVLMVVLVLLEQYLFTIKI
jgi:hypothetical protein